MKILLVTGNLRKLNEWRRLLPKNFVLEHADIDLTEIQSMDPQEVVTDKARRAYELLKQPVMVEDVSAGLDMLNGLPGPFIKFFIEALGEDALRQLATSDGDTATVACTVAYFDGKEMLTVKGEVNGTVVSARGEDGFGFDKVFIPNGQVKTYAEMTHQEKDAVSHRAVAAKLFISALEGAS